MVEKRGWPDPDEVKAFLEAGYTKEQILELIVGIAQKTISNYVNHIAGTPVDEAAVPFRTKVKRNNYEKLCFMPYHTQSGK